MKWLGAVTRLITLVLMMSLAPFACAFAFWQYDGNAVCRAARGQFYPEITPDGEGGAVVTWLHDPDTLSDIYAQRVDEAGNLLWTTSGVAVCEDTDKQDHPRIISDGSGGAIIVWSDHRGDDYDIYAQRVNASGIPLWGANGVPICLEIGEQDYPVIASDGAGGAIICWHDSQSAGQFDIYARRVDTSGKVLWTNNGVAVCSEIGNQMYPEITSDGVGGAIIVWLDRREGGVDHIYAQRVDGSGALMWTANGVAVCKATGVRWYPKLASDGAGGAIITWYDWRANTGYAVYVQRVDTFGAPLYENGVVICAHTVSPFDHWAPAISADGAGGAIVIWQDVRNVETIGIYAQRVSASGSPSWVANGIAVSASAGSQERLSITSDGAGGAITCWTDHRSGNHDIYAQRMDPSGHSLWAADGSAVCTASGVQKYSVITQSGVGGAIICWQDVRSGLDSDIYAQKMPPRFSRPLSTRFRDAE
jgi:transposase